MEALLKWHRWLHMLGMRAAHLFDMFCTLPVLILSCCLAAASFQKWLK